MGQDRVFPGIHILRIDLFEALISALLPVEELEHHNAGYMLLQKRIDAGDGHSHPPVGVAHHLAKNHGGPKDDRKHGKGNQGQPPLHAQHDDDDTGQDEYVLEDGHHARSEHLVERVHVAGDTRDQAAHRILVEESNMYMLQVAKNLLAQVKHDLLSGPLHQVGLQKLHHKTDE